MLLVNLSFFKKIVHKLYLKGAIETIRILQVKQWVCILKGLLQEIKDSVSHSQGNLQCSLITLL